MDTKNIARIVLSIVCCFGCSANAAAADVRVASQPVQYYFQGDQKIQLTLTNTSDAPVEKSLSWRLYQASAATIAPVTEARPWKGIAVLPHTGTNEELTCTFPEVRAPAIFLIKISDGESNAIGEQRFQVFPTNLLYQLKQFASDKVIGVWDQTGELARLLDAAKVPVMNLAEKRDAFDGTLAIMGPFAAHDAPEELRGFLRGKNVPRNVVWIESGEHPLQPPTYLVNKGGMRILNVSASLLGNLTNSPLSQLRLIKYTESLIKPESLPFEPLKEH